jgi:glycine cleavage system H protein
MLAGVVDYKLCDRNLDCERCPFDLSLKGGEAKAGSRLETIPAHSPLEVQSFELKDAVFYHPSHVWASVEDKGNIRIGLDNFAQSLIGRVYNVSLPHEGLKIERGKYYWTVTHKAGETRLVVPLSGTVLEVNWKLKQFPSLLNRDPFGSGWAFIIKPTDLKTGLGDLFYGPRAVKWHGAEMDRLYSAASELSNSCALPDGGRFTKDFLSELSADQMQQLIDRFLPGPEHSAHRHFGISKSKRR